MELVTVDNNLDEISNVSRLTRGERQRIGRRLRAIRVERELTQNNVADDPNCGLSYGTIQAIETARYVVKDTNVDKLARYYGTSLLALLHANDPKAQDPRLEHLHDEHLEVARGYMRAPRAVRAGVELLLLSHHPQTDHLTRLLVTLAALPADRLAHLDAWLASDDETRRILELVRAHLVDPNYPTYGSLVTDGLRLLEQRKPTTTTTHHKPHAHKKSTAPSRR